MGVGLSALARKGNALLMRRAVCLSADRLAENPKTITREWANVAAQKKIGKAPIYWETRAAVSEDDY